MTGIPLGASGVDTSRLGLGCVAFGREIGESDSFAIMDFAFENGIRLFDTAEGYGAAQARAYRREVYGIDDSREATDEPHSSEAIIGRWLRSRGVRTEVVLCSKINSNDVKTAMSQALKGSLHRLQTDWIDVYLLHQYRTDRPLGDTLEFLENAASAGLVRASGCCNLTASELKSLLSERGNAGNFPQIVQNNYNLLVRDIELDLMPIIKREGIGIMSYSPLAGGFLTGKYSRDPAYVQRGSRFHVIPGHIDLYFHDRNFAVVGALGALSSRVGIPAGILALRWVLANPGIDVILVGATKVAHIENAVQAARLRFETEWFKEVEELGRSSLI